MSGVNILLTVPQAASLLAVSEDTIHEWIYSERIPYVALPTGEYLIPQGGLLSSLSELYDLGAELRAMDAKFDHLDESDAL